MAEEMTKFTRNQIMTDSATAMLAQANARSQSILRLFNWSKRGSWRFWKLGIPESSSFESEWVFGKVSVGYLLMNPWPEHTFNWWWWIKLFEMKVTVKVCVAFLSKSVRGLRTIWILTEWISNPRRDSRAHIALPKDTSPPGIEATRSTCVCRTVTKRNWQR